PDPVPGKRVHDFTATLSADEELALENLLRRTETITTAETAVVIVPTLDGLSVDEYAVQLFNRWGIGKADYNNGLLFLIAPREKRVRIEIGYGLERFISDGQSGAILDYDVT